MTQPEDIRRFPRLNAGPGSEAQFRADSKSHFNVPLVDFGAGGCCIRLSNGASQALEKGMPISGLVLNIPDLPLIRLQGRIAWVLGKSNGRQEGGVLVGIEFTDVPKEVGALLCQYIESKVHLTIA